MNLKLSKLIAATLAAVLFFGSLVLYGMFSLGTYHVKVPVKKAVEEFCQEVKKPGLIEVVDGPVHIRYKCVSGSKDDWRRLPEIEMIPVNRLDHFCMNEKKFVVVRHGEIECVDDAHPFWSKDRFEW